MERNFCFFILTHLLNRSVIFLQSHNAYFPFSENGTLLCALATLYWSLAPGLFSKCTQDFQSRTKSTLLGVLVLSLVVGHIHGRGRNCIQPISINVLRRNQAEFVSGNTMRSGKNEASKTLLCWIWTSYAVLQKVIPSFYDC